MAPLMKELRSSCGLEGDREKHLVTFFQSSITRKNRKDKTFLILNPNFLALMTLLLASDWLVIDRAPRSIIQLA